MSYYNTNHLTADQLRDAIASCNRQEIRVRQLSCLLQTKANAEVSDGEKGTRP